MASNAIATIEELDWSVINAVVTSGDLSGLDDKQKTAYYRMFCESVGLNPVTQPFAYVKMNGKVLLYALKGATEQLRQTRKITLRIVSQEIMEGMFIVTVEATTPDGRTDTDVGVVALPREAGETRANAIMKAITKAKRRVTLSICGLGLNDETEIETIPGARILNTEDLSTSTEPRAIREPAGTQSPPQPARIAPLSAPRTKAAVVEDEDDYPDRIAPQTLKWLQTVASENGWKPDDMKQLIGEKYPNAVDPATGLPSSRFLTDDEGRELIAYITPPEPAGDVIEGAAEQSR